MTITLLQGDCLELLPTLAPHSIDAIITDLPYGTTACKWDTVIPFAPMWAAVKRLLKPRGVFVTTASQPFTSALVMSNLEWFKYEWIFDKGLGTGFLDAQRKPLKRHDNVLVFYQDQCTYNPQMKKGSHHRNGALPHNGCTTPVYGKFKTLDAYHTNLYFPISIIDCAKEPQHTRVHPTQKPVALYAYLIRTYTNAGDTVLDFTMGSGTTGVAAAKEGRNFVGIELDAGYHAIAQKRIAEAQMQPSLLEVA